MNTFRLSTFFKRRYVVADATRNDARNLCRFGLGVQMKKGDIEVLAASALRCLPRDVYHWHQVMFTT